MQVMSFVFFKKISSCPNFRLQTVGVEHFSKKKEQIVTSSHSDNQCLIVIRPEVIKHFSCSTQLSMKLFLLTNIKMPTIVGILKFISGKNSILGLYEPKKRIS